MNTGHLQGSIATGRQTAPNSQKAVALARGDHNFRDKLLIMSGVVSLTLLAILLTLNYGDELDSIRTDLEQTPLMIGAKILLMINLSVLVWRVLLVMTRKDVLVCDDDELLTCTVIIPAYNEGRQVLETMRSVARSDFPMGKLQIVCVDDGSRDDTWQWMQAGGDELGDLVELVRQPVNKGKRHALYEGFKRAKGQIWITIDSDSEVEPMALRQMVSSFCRNHRVGAVAGNVRVLNKTEGILPRMLDVVFTFSFDFIRQTQGRVNTVFCTPGALSGYRGCAVEPILEEWLKQRFMGREANIGEDRAMTNLILREGWLVHFQGNAVVYTNVPTRYMGLCKMYLRWARSDVRETIAMSRFIFNKVRPEPMSGARINLCLAVMRLILAEAFKIVMIWGLVAIPLLTGYNLLLGLLIAGVIPATVHRLRHGGWDFLWAFPYMAFSLFALSWISLYAMCTPHRNGWLTRTLPAPQPQQVLQMIPQPLEHLAVPGVVLQGEMGQLQP